MTAELGCRCPSCLPLAVYRCYRYAGWLWLTSFALLILSLAGLSLPLFVLGVAANVTGTALALAGTYLEDRAAHR